MYILYECLYEVFMSYCKFNLIFSGKIYLLAVKDLRNNETKVKCGRFSNWELINEPTIIVNLLYIIYVLYIYKGIVISRDYIYFSHFFLHH